MLSTRLFNTTALRRITTTIIGKSSHDDNRDEHTNIGEFRSVASDEM